MQAKWTDQILDEAFLNLIPNRPDLDPSTLDRTRDLMNRAVRDCLLTGYEPLIDAVTLPDPDDRHVLAAAIKARAQVIVTNNLQDFPPHAMSTSDIEVKSADSFVLNQIDRDRDEVYAAVQRIANTRTRPPATV